MARLMARFRQECSRCKCGRAERSGLRSQPLVDVLGAQLAELAGAEGRDDVHAGTRWAHVGDGDRVAAVESVGEPVGDGPGDGVALGGDREAVFIVAQEPDAARTR